MPASRSRIRDLLAHPRENINTEVKDWFDPSTPEGKAKIAKASIALRNANGGFLLIGFTNDTLIPNVEGAPDDLATTFHHDVVQAIVSKFSSRPFEVHLHFPIDDEPPYVAVEIEAGVKHPAACRADLFDSENKKLLHEHSIYVRSLHSSGVVSSTLARHQDLERLAEICFDNREADIGRFLRRHLTGADPTRTEAFIAELRQVSGPDPTAMARQLLERGVARYHDAIANRKLNLPSFGTWEVAAASSREVPERLSADAILRLLGERNPEYTGWPPWVNTANFADPTTRPYTFEGAREALVWSERGTWGSAHLDFWRIDPSGSLYLLRSLQDDMVSPERVPPEQYLDPALAVLRTTEAMIVASEIIRGMGIDPEATYVAFAFRWSGLAGRELLRWADRSLFRNALNRRCVQPTATSEVSVPLAVAPSAVAPFVEKALVPLFQAFDGFEMPSQAIERLVERLVNREL